MQTNWSGESDFFFIFPAGFMNLALIPCVKSDGHRDTLAGCFHVKSPEQSPF